MKKILKLFLTILLIISLVYIVTGCANKNESENNTITNEIQESTKSKTYNALSKVFSQDDYIMTVKEEMDFGEGPEDTIITIAVKGEEIYMNINSISNNVTVIYMDDITYTVSNDNKKYTTSEGKNEQLFGQSMAIFTKDDLKDIETAEYTTGKEKIDEIEYEYEEYENDEGIIERYYFLDDNLMYIKSIDKDGTEEIMKVIRLSSDVDDKLFEIPSDYERIEM